MPAGRPHSCAKTGPNVYLPAVEEKALIRAALLRLNAPDRAIQSFDNCAATWTMMRHKTTPNLFVRRPIYCTHRFCPSCSARRTNRVANNLIQRMRDDEAHHPSHDWSLLTLTLCHSTQPLNAQLARLQQAFKKLRRHNLWKFNVSGGVAFIELQHNQNTRLWHPHLHMLIEAGYVAKSALSDAWRHVTGDSYILDIRRVRQSAAACRYIAKYATKPVPIALARDAPALDEAIRALAGRRTILCFGMCTGWKVTHQPGNGEWEVLATQNELYIKAGQGDPLFLALRAAIENDRDQWEPFSLPEPQTHTRSPP